MNSMSCRTKPSAPGLFVGGVIVSHMMEVPGRSRHQGRADEHEAQGHSDGNDGYGVFAVHAKFSFSGR